MPRAISMRHTTVAAGDRDGFRKNARESQTHYLGAECRYWLYEEDELPGAYVEFVEAADRETLGRAHRAASAAMHLRARLYVEVDLT